MTYVSNRSECSAELPTQVEILLGPALFPAAAWSRNILRSAPVCQSETPCHGDWASGAIRVVEFLKSEQGDGGVERFGG